jgi:chromosome segregation ATPase
MDGKKALELRVENLTAELQKAKSQAGDAEASTQQLQVHTSTNTNKHKRCSLLAWLMLLCGCLCLPESQCACWLTWKKMFYHISNITVAVLSCAPQDTIDDLKVQLQQQKTTASDAAQQLVSKEEELAQVKATSSNKLQAWQSKIEELKTVSAAKYLVWCDRRE